MWLSKQHTGFCGTRVQVAYYSGQINDDVGCPNCGEKETASHLCVCPNKGRTKLLTETVKELESWMGKGGETQLKLAYQIPKYIRYRGTKEFADMGRMSPPVTDLAKNQDKIGRRNFMEGMMSKDFYHIQSHHLAFGKSYLNGRNWIKQFISRILRITHSQWVFRNFLLYDKERQYLRLKEKA